MKCQSQRQKSQTRHKEEFRIKSSRTKPTTMRNGSDRVYIKEWIEQVRIYLLVKCFSF